MRSSVSNILEGLGTINESTKNYKFITNNKIDKTLKDEYGKFFDKVESFAKIMDRSNKGLKVVLDFGDVVGMGKVGYLYLYGFNTMYDTEDEFIRFSAQTYKQMQSLVKSMIGRFDSSDMTTYWTAKRAFGNKTIETGPYIEFVFKEDTMYSGVSEAVGNKEYLSDFKKGEILYVFGTGDCVIKTAGKKKYVLEPVDKENTRGALKAEYMNPSNKRVEVGKDGKYILM